MVHNQQQKWAVNVYLLYTEKHGNSGPQPAAEVGSECIHSSKYAGPYRNSTDKCICTCLTNIWHRAYVPV